MLEGAPCQSWGNFRSSIERLQFRLLNLSSFLFFCARKTTSPEYDDIPEYCHGRVLLRASDVGWIKIQSKECSVFPAAYLCTPGRLLFSGLLFGLRWSYSLACMSSIDASSVTGILVRSGRLLTVCRRNIPSIIGKILNAICSRSSLIG